MSDTAKEAAKGLFGCGCLMGIVGLVLIVLAVVVPIALLFFGALANMD